MISCRKRKGSSQNPTKEKEKKRQEDNISGVF
jgi:hypothetical protein